MTPKPTQTPPPVPDTAELSTGNPALTRTPSFNIIDGSNIVTFSLNVHRHTPSASSNSALASTSASTRPRNIFAGSRSTAQDPASDVCHATANTVSPAEGTLSTGLSKAVLSTDSPPARPSNGITGIRSTTQDGVTPIRPATANTDSPSRSTPNAGRGIENQETTTTTGGAPAVPKITRRTLYSICEPYYTSPAPEGGRAGINSANYRRREPTEEEAALARLAALIPQMPAQAVYTFGDGAFGRSPAPVGPTGTNITDFPASRHWRDPVGMFGTAPSTCRMDSRWQNPPQQYDPFQGGRFASHSRAVQPPGPTLPPIGPEMGYYPPHRNAAWPGGFSGPPSGFSCPPSGNRNYNGRGIPGLPPGFITTVNPPLNFYGFPYAPGGMLRGVLSQQAVSPPFNFYGFPYAPAITHGATTSYQAHAPTRGEPTLRPPTAGRPGAPTLADTAVTPPPAYTHSGTFPLTINLHPDSTTLTVIVTAADPSASLTYDDFIHTISARLQLPRFWIQPQGGFVVRFNMGAARRLVENEELSMVDVWDVDEMELNLLAVGKEEWEKQLEAWRAEGRGWWPMGISRWEEYEDAE